LGLLVRDFPQLNNIIRNIFVCFLEKAGARGLSTLLVGVGPIIDVESAMTALSALDWTVFDAGAEKAPLLKDPIFWAKSVIASFLFKNVEEYQYSVLFLKRSMDEFSCHLTLHLV
jgi:hypothetical protein